MNIEAGAYRFYINSEWVVESGLKPFSKTNDHYLYKLYQAQAGPVIIVNYDDIDPNIRGKDTPIFKNGITYLLATCPNTSIPAELSSPSHEAGCENNESI